MKQATLLAVFIATAAFSCASSVNDNYRPRIKTPGDTSLMKVTVMHEMLQQIVAATGLQTEFELKEANVLNIEASISHRKRYILYNPTYISTLNKITKNKWAVMALLAHEVGHHLNGHTIRKGGSTPELELEADEFAGFILHKLGATLDQSQNVMHYIAKVKESKTHPSRGSRLLAIEKGWNNGSGLPGINATAKQ
jgi:hypothetical protein